jgi:hypothetical protein
LNGLDLGALKPKLSEFQALMAKVASPTSIGKTFTDNFDNAYRAMLFINNLATQNPDEAIRIKHKVKVISPKGLNDAQAKIYLYGHLATDVMNILKRHLGRIYSVHKTDNKTQFLALKSILKDVSPVNKRIVEMKQALLSHGTNPLPHVKHVTRDLPGGGHVNRTRSGAWEVGNEFTDEIQNHEYGSISMASPYST